MEKTQKKKTYVPPTVKVSKVVLEEGIAQMVAVSAKITEVNWIDDGETVGSNPAIEGGDILLF